MPVLGLSQSEGEMDSVLCVNAPLALAAHFIAGRASAL